MEATFSLSLPMWNIEAETGYKPKTTFWQDFSIADKFGVKAVRDTFNRAFREWKNDVIYITELSLVLNHKSWQHYTHHEIATDNRDTATAARAKALSMEYATIWTALEDWVKGYTDANGKEHPAHLKGEDMEYYFNTTD